MPQWPGAGKLVRTAPSVIRAVVEGKQGSRAGSWALFSLITKLCLVCSQLLSSPASLELWQRHAAIFQVSEASPKLADKAGLSKLEGFRELSLTDGQEVFFLFSSSQARAQLWAAHRSWQRSCKSPYAPTDFCQACRAARDGDHQHLCAGGGE